MKIEIEAKFPKLERGNDCEGKAIRNEAGKQVGSISREIDWIDTGSTSVSYSRHKVTGYKLDIWDGETDEQTFTSLAHASAAARAHFAKK